MPIVKLSGSDSLFSIWKDQEKDELTTTKSNTELLEKYIAYCVSEINKFLSAAKENLDQSRWTCDKSIENRVLTVTVVNGLDYLFEEANRRWTKGQFSPVIKNSFPV